MKRKHPLSLRRLACVVLAGLSLLAIALPASARTQIRIVGSSTVYPFSSYVAQEFGNSTPFPTPVVESTGSGGGHKIFGSGVGTDTPDITNSSRAIKVSELLRARDNGVDEIIEAAIGYDGIVLAQRIDNPPLDISLEHLALAVLAEVPGDNGLIKNPYNKWSDIDSDLPDLEIRVYGPPSTSGTRDAFEELVLEVATKSMDAYGGAYDKVRTDGKYIPSGENDNLIVARLENDKDAFGVFGYSFLEENQDKIRGASIDGVAPMPDTISSGDYPVSRSMYFYVKKAHIGEIPGLLEFIELFM
ncbi:MAG: substrate-binding domain-containing protein, partial [Phycisphaeraceae bacterium]